MGKAAREKAKQRQIWLSSLNPDEEVARVHPDTLERLAEADAFAALGLTQRDALWDAKALKAPAALPLFGPDGEGSAEPIVSLPQMTLVMPTMVAPVR